MGWTWSERFDFLVTVSVGVFIGMGGIKLVEYYAIWIYYMSPVR